MKTNTIVSTIFLGFFLAGTCLEICASQDSIPQKLVPSVTHSLKDAYLAALKTSETLNVQKELVVQADEGLSQANGALFPTISGSYSFLNQATPSSVTGSAIFPASQSTGRLTLTQPLFRGLRDFAALRQKRFLVGSQLGAYQVAARQLFYDVATAYYNVLIYQSDVKNYEAVIEVNLKRLKELDRFFKIGRAQLTDVLTFKSNIASVEAQLEVSRGQVESAKEVLTYLTGWGRDTSLSDDEPHLLQLESAGTYVAQIENRPEIKAALENLSANHEFIPISWGAHLPSLDLIGNYYLVRPGVLKDVNWDVQVALTFPLFQGGIVQSQVRQAESVVRQYDLVLSQTRRVAEQEIRVFYNSVLADSKQFSKLKELVSVAKQNAETEVKYYRNGLVTNLDVLNAMTTYQDAQRQMDRQSYAFKLDTVKLKAATGQRPEIGVTHPQH